MPKGLVSILLMVWMTIGLLFQPAYAQDRGRTIRQHHHTAWTSKDGAPPEIWAMD